MRLLVAVYKTLLTTYKMCYHKDMKKTLQIGLLSLFIISIFSYAPALALDPPQSDNINGLVECGKIDPNAAPGTTSNECGFNDLISLVGRVVRFTIFNIVIPLVTLVIFYYGIMIVISGDKPAKLTELKKSLWKVGVGLFFMLTAWLIVESIVGVLKIKLQDPSNGGKIENGPIKLIDFK
jgi:Type IV secretion system pilin